MFIEIDKLTLSALQALARGEILALRVKNYYPAALCHAAAARITEYNTADFYEVTKSAGLMKKIGPAIFDYAENPDAIGGYYDQLPEARAAIANLFDGWNPLEKLQNELNLLWESSCEIEKLHNSPMYYGLVRIFEKGSFALPHQDMTHWDMSNCARAQSIVKQFAVNIYLQVPKIGGQLMVFNKSIRDRQEYEATKISGSYGLKIDDIPMLQQVSIKPTEGDLIISNSQMIHAVLENKDKIPRYTTSCFINYRGNAEPLCMFS